MFLYVNQIRASNFNSGWLKWGQLNKCILWRPINLITYLYIKLSLILVDTLIPCGSIPTDIVVPHYSDVMMGTMASQITSLAIVYSIVYSGADQRKHQSSASLAFVRGIHRWPMNSPQQGPVTRKNFQWMMSSWKEQIVRVVSQYRQSYAGGPSNQCGAMWTEHVPNLNTRNIWILVWYILPSVCLGISQPSQLFYAIYEAVFPAYPFLFWRL